MEIIWQNQQSGMCKDSDRPWPGCSKLTTLLVNISLKFQMLKTEICQYFLLKKCEKLSLMFSTKNISAFGYKVINHLTS